MIRKNLKPTEKQQGVMVNIARFVLAAVFLFSGFVKAVDPKGTAYKLSEYAVYFHLDGILNEQICLLLSVCLAALEFILGIYLLFGIRRKFSSLLALLILVVFTPFTLFLAIQNPVSDCGCFGDAIKLTNWQTFFKNVVLLVLSVAVYIRHRKIFYLAPRSFHWAISLYTIIFIFLFSFFSIYYLPLIDFRPYKIGTNIVQSMSVPEGAPLPEYKTTFIMEKNGRQKEFTLDNYPDSTWTYVKRVSKVVRKGYVPPITDFAISDSEGHDLTDSILNDPTPTFLLISPSYKQADRDVTDEINSIYDYCTDHHYHFYGLTASGDDEILKWRYATGSAYPIYRADDVVLRTMIRSNPGLMLLRRGTILNKWSSNDLPKVDLQNEPTIQALTENVEEAKSVKVLLKMGLIYVIPLLFITLAHNLWHIRRKKEKGTVKETTNSNIKSI